MQGVENVYTQHSPPLVGLLEKLAKAKLPETDYPRVDRGHSLQAPKVRRVGAKAVLGSKTRQGAEDKRMGLYLEISRWRGIRLG